MSNSLFLIVNGNYKRLRRNVCVDRYTTIRSDTKATLVLSKTKTIDLTMFNEHRVDL